MSEHSLMYLQLPLVQVAKYLPENLPATALYIADSTKLGKVRSNKGQKQQGPNIWCDAQ